MNVIMMKGSITSVIHRAITYSYNPISYIKLVEEHTTLKNFQVLGKYSYDQNDNNEIW